MGRIDIGTNINCQHVVSTRVAGCATRATVECRLARMHIVYGPITIAIRARFEYDSSTIRARFERDTTSYEELCAFEQ